MTPLHLRQYSRMTKKIIYIVNNYWNIMPRTLLYDNRYFSTKVYQKDGNRRFTDKHEWISVCGNVGIIGISDYAQKSLGDIDFAQLPDVGEILEKDSICGALESVKAASEIFCPVSGKVVDKNLSVELTPRIINNSCYDEGWLFKVELTNPNEVNELLSENEYELYLKCDTEIK